MLARLILLAVLIVASSGEPFAQVGPDTTKVATKTKTVNFQQLGATRVAPPIQTVTIQKPTKLDDIAKTNRLEADPATLETIRKLNPSVDFSKELQRGQTVRVPYWKDANTRLSLSYADLAKAQVAPKTAAFDGRLNAAKQLPPKAFESPNAAEAYQGALQNISQTVKQAEMMAPQLSDRQLAYLDYQLSTLERKTGRLQQRATTGAAPITVAEARELQSAPVQIQSAMLEFPVVRVKAFNGARPVCYVKVYAIPDGARFDRFMEIDDLDRLIKKWSFDKFASPTESTFPPDTNWAVWVDQDKLHSEYAKRIKNGSAPPPSIFTVKASSSGAQEVDITSTLSSFCTDRNDKK